MSIRRHAPLLAGVAMTLLAAGCSAPGLPEGEGDGLVSADREPPPGAQVYERPVWQAGDRFVFVRGGVLRVPLRVIEATEEGYVLEHEENGVRTNLTTDLGLSGLDIPGQPEARRREVPPENLLHWPLWEGKRWSSHFLRKQVGAPALPLMVSYHCDAVETVQVPAGELRCLRIWRRARVALPEQQFLERTAVLWYAPEVGYFARRLESGSMMDLESYHRQ